MINRSPSLFFTALVLTLVIHLYSVDHLARWLNRSILPQLSDESIEIDIEQVDRLPPLEDYTRKKTPELIEPNVTQKPKKLPSTKPPQKPASSKKETILNPKEKKQLDESLIEDRTSASKDKNLQARKAETQQRQMVTNLDLKEKPQIEKKKAQKKIREDTDPLLPSKKPAEKDDQISPMFLKKPKQKETPELKKTIPAKIEIPKEIQKTFRNGNPEATKKENLEYSMNTYKWTFKRYVENWAVDIQKWWKAPLDYRYGRVPDGGEMWIQVRLAKSGSLLGYKIVKSNITAEMELMVIQALVGSLSQPALPELFPKDELIINWRFIYPPMRPEIDLRRR